MSRLTTQQLTVHIAGKTVCDKLDLKVEAGQVWGILGRNGVGKTTLLHSLAGLYPTTQGSIRLDNRDLHSIRRKPLAQKLGLLLQQNEEAFPSSVMEMVLSGRHPHIGTWSWESDEDRRIAHTALQVVNMLERQNDSIDQLSGGEKQRVSLARLLAQSPDIYLLDEPDTHLDLHYQVDILQHFTSLAKDRNASVIMTLHDIQLAHTFCTHLLLLYGEGQHKLGDCDELLTEKNLGELYQHPINRIDSDRGPVFLPDMLTKS